MAGEEKEIQAFREPQYPDGDKGRQVMTIIVPEEELESLLQAWFDENNMRFGDNGDNANNLFEYIQNACETM